MSSGYPERPFSADGPEQDPFARLDLFEHDPRFAEILSEIAVMQKAYVTAMGDEDAVKESLSLINEKLGYCGWVGDRVTVTGKIRLAPWAEKDNYDSDYFEAQGLIFDEDEIGKYCQANGLPMNLALIDVDEDAHMHSNEGRYVLTFHTPDEVEDAKHDATARRDLLERAGDFMMYPDQDELMPLEFGTPSIEQIEKTLQLFYPDAYKMISELINESTGNRATRLLEDLKKLTLPVPIDGITPEALMDIGRYIYDLTEIDKESDYRFVLDGPISGLSIEQGLVDAKQPRDTRLTGKIVKLDFDSVTLRATFIVSQLSSIGEGYELRVIPIDSVKRLQCLRPLQSAFGGLAMLNFDDPADVEQYWAESKTTAAKQKKDAETALVNDLESFFDEIKSEYSFEKAPDVTEISLDEDIDSLVASYVDHVVTAVDLQSPDDAFDNVNEMLRKDVESLKHLSIGATVATDNEAIIIRQSEVSSDGTIEYGIDVIDKSQRLSGEFVDIVVAQFPSQQMIDSNGEHTDLVTGLGIVLAGARVFGKDDENGDYENLGDEVIVKVAPMVATRFTKINREIGE